MDVAIRRAISVTAGWVALLDIPTFLALLGKRNVISYGWYRRPRLARACLLLVLAFGSIYRVAQQVAQTLATPAPRPWYTRSLIPSFVIFWALFPPVGARSPYSFRKDVVSRLAGMWRGSTPRLVAPYSRNHSLCTHPRSPVLVSTYIHSPCCRRPWTASPAAQTGGGTEVLLCLPMGL